MIQVDDLTFAYPGSDGAAVHDLSFAIAPGEVFGFLGPSGAGKSTTQKILIGLLDDYRGRAQVFGRELREWGQEYYERIGVSFEFPNHYLKLSALENLRYFGSLYRSRLRDPRQLLDEIGLGDDWDQQVGQYSKGMKGRLSVARALLHDPDLLFLDEPTAGLDPTNARRVVDLIAAQRAAGKTVFLTTHDMMVADELCDRVAILHAGQIAVIGPPRQLKLEHGEDRVRVEFAGSAGTEHAEFPLEDIGANGQFLALLRDRDIQTIHTLEANLADVFIQVTGQGLHE